MKKYVNAKQVLPDLLIEEIQKYIQGSYIYIPKTERVAWGASTGIRDELNQRNEQIRKLYKNGFEVLKLAELYGLSEERIRAIIYGYIYPIKKNTDEVIKAQNEQQVNKIEAMRLFQEKSQKYELPLVVVDVKTDILDDKNILFFYCKSNTDIEIDWNGLNWRELGKELSEIFEHTIGIRETV